VTASRNVFLQATAQSQADITTRNPLFGMTYGSSSPTAKVEVENGVVIVAAGRRPGPFFGNNRLSVKTIVPASGEIAHFSIAYAKARTLSRALLAAGSSVSAANLTVRAISNNFYSTIAQSAGFTDSESLGLGAAIVSSSYDSSAEAIVAGNVSLTGNLFIDADSLDFKKRIKILCEDRRGLSMTPFLEKLQEFLSGLANFL